MHSRGKKVKRGGKNYATSLANKLNSCSNSASKIYKIFSAVTFNVPEWLHNWQLLRKSSAP
jgi:hypothetical protein